MALGILKAARRRRWTLQGIEPDLAFAAAGLPSPAAWPALFAANYGLAVLVVFANLSVPLTIPTGLLTAFP